tara:strand:- start:389 stop:598 length:210 start_codon:yes stop_codon:yes gene_type:complete
MKIKAKKSYRNFEGKSFLSLGRGLIHSYLVNGEEAELEDSFKIPKELSEHIEIKKENKTKKKVKEANNG